MKRLVGCAFDQSDQISKKIKELELFYEMQERLQAFSAITTFLSL